MSSTVGYVAGDAVEMLRNYASYMIGLHFSAGAYCKK